MGKRLTAASLLSGVRHFASEGEYLAAKARRLPDLTPCQMIVFVEMGQYEALPLEARRIVVESGYAL